MTIGCTQNSLFGALFRQQVLETVEKVNKKKEEDTVVKSAWPGHKADPELV